LVSAQELAGFGLLIAAERALALKESVTTMDYVAPDVPIRAGIIPRVDPKPSNVDLAVSASHKSLLFRGISMARIAPAHLIEAGALRVGDVLVCASRSVFRSFVCSHP
jgi:hypothetical protein